MEKYWSCLVDYSILKEYDPEAGKIKKIKTEF